MIGIYKITNKINGKSYIGQSIHCGKRLDEHLKGNQFIDEIIQLEGVGNFIFEILKEVEKEELSLWEDYYINKYNTLFPNGYNKRWNCKKEDRDKFIKENLSENKEINQNNINSQYQAQHKNIKLYNKNSGKITAKQWKIYYWLISISNNIVSEDNEKYKCVFKKDINISYFCKENNIKSNKTFYNAIEKLSKCGLLENFSDYFLLYSFDSFNIPPNIFNILLSYSNNENYIDLLRIYLILKDIKVNATNENDKKFSARTIVKLLNYGISNSCSYERVRICLSKLEELNLIRLDINLKQNFNDIEYQEYYLKEIY